MLISNTCPTCNGTGWKGDAHCSSCEAMGVLSIIDDIDLSHRAATKRHQKPKRHKPRKRGRYRKPTKAKRDKRQPHLCVKVHWVISKSTNTRLKKIAAHRHCTIGEAVDLVTHDWSERCSRLTDEQARFITWEAQRRNKTKQTILTEILNNIMGQYPHPVWRQTRCRK